MKTRYQVLTMAYLRNLFGLDKKVSGAYLELRPMVEDQVGSWVVAVTRSIQQVPMQASSKEVQQA